MSFNMKKLIMVILAVVFIAGVLIFKDFLLDTELGNVVLVMYIIAYSAFCIVFWRCKHCKRPLGKLSFFAKYCPYCGDEL